MKRSRLGWALVTCGVMTLLPGQLAQGSDSRGYLRFDGGINFAEDPVLETGPEKRKLKLDSGYRADLAVGYDLKQWLGFELQAGYIYNSAESLTLGNLAVDVDDTWLQGIPVLANVRLRYPTQGNFVPYVGGGAGGLVSMLSIMRNTDTDVVFAYELTAGVIYKIDDRAWIDINYKYLAAGDPEYNIGSTHVKASKLRNHFIGASIIWRF